MRERSPEGLRVKRGVGGILAQENGPRQEGPAPVPDPEASLRLTGLRQLLTHICDIINDNQALKFHAARYTKRPAP